MLRADLPSPPPATREQTRGLRLQPTLLIIFAVVALEFALSFWLARYLNDDVGLARPSAAALVSALYAANLTGRLLASRLARTHAPEHLLFAAIGLVLAGLPDRPDPRRGPRFSAHPPGRPEIRAANPDSVTRRPVRRPTSKPSILSLLTGTSG